MPITTSTCPTDCAADELPVISYLDCAPEQKLSELAYMYVALLGAADFADASLLDEWSARISNTATPPEGSETPVKDLIRMIPIIGDMPAPNVTNTDISGARNVITKADRTVNFDIDEVTDENYQFVRKTECGYMKAKIWFETRGGVLLGGNSGINAKIVAHPVYARGSAEIEKYTGTVTWEDKISPDRCPSPIAH
jgi:hypothetical protein